jgi:hypothetical protein
MQLLRELLNLALTLESSFAAKFLGGIEAKTG